MVARKYLISGAIALVAIVAVVYFFPTETRRIKRQFTSFAKWVEKTPEESNLSMVSKLNWIKMAFAETCRFRDPAHDFSGEYPREEIVRQAAGARAHFSKLTLKFADLAVTFPQADIANVTTTATATGISTEGDAFEETHELECILQKIEGNWLLTEVTVVEVLKK
jgi:hypothetical protein